MKTCSCSCGTTAPVSEEKKHTQSKVEVHAHSNENFIGDYWKVILSFLLLMGGIIVGQFTTWFDSQRYIALLWYLVAYIPVGLPVIKEAWESMLEREFFSEFTLMSIATIGAFIIGEYPEGVAVMLFYSVGELFQDKAVSRARRNIASLLDVRPELAFVVENDAIISVSPNDVMVGTTIEVKAGERVPLDGIMITGKATFNTSALTGESVPKTFMEGEEVLAGMIVTDTVVRLQVSKTFGNSALSRILALVQEASDRKAPAELFIRKFARVYTPVVTGLAGLIVLLPFIYSLVSVGFSYEFYTWFYRALVFLVISCPCALVVSIPLGYFGGIGAASRLGILFKGGNYLDAITKINTVVFDKTGTLTNGTFDVVSVQTADDVSTTDLIAAVASVEKSSNHPIALAVQRYADSKGVATLAPEKVKELAGFGLNASINGSEILVGNTRLLDKFEVDYPESLSSIPETIVTCAVNGKFWGYLLVADTLKEDAVTAIKDLQKSGIHNIQILSGDKQNIVSAIAEKVGVKIAYGDLLPEGKVRHIEQLKQNEKNQIAFVGDGMNDAPVLALSNVGIAMGGLGSDAAIETADVVIQSDHPSKVATAIKVGRLTRNIVWQNIILAFGVKVVVLILGAGGLATLWEAVFADVGVALIAILNAVRIQKYIKK